MLKKDPPPTPSISLISQASTVRKLWRRKRADGAEIDAVLFYHSALGEATVELTVRSAHAQDAIAEGLAADVLATLDMQGATEEV